MLLDIVNPNICPICRGPAQALPTSTRRTPMCCDSCVEFTITWSADTPDDPTLQALLSLAARQGAQAGKPLTITQEFIQSFITSKHRLVVTERFNAWRKSQRDDPQKRVFPIRPGPQIFLFANIGASGEFVAFDMDAVEYEADRSTFLKSTRAARTDEIPPPPY